jgi:hypothetical protein
VQAAAAGQLHYPGDLLGGGGEHHGIGEAALDGGVVLVDQEVLGRVNDAIAADNGLQFADELAVSHGNIQFSIGGA